MRKPGLPALVLGLTILALVMGGISGAQDRGRADGLNSEAQGLPIFIVVQDRYINVRQISYLDIPSDTKLSEISLYFVGSDDPLKFTGDSARELAAQLTPYIVTQRR